MNRRKVLFFRLVYFWLIYMTIINVNYLNGTSLSLYSFVMAVIIFLYLYLLDLLEFQLKQKNSRILFKTFPIFLLYFLTNFGGSITLFLVLYHSLLWVIATIYVQTISNVFFKGESYTILCIGLNEAEETDISTLISLNKQLKLYQSIDSTDQLSIDSIVSAKIDKIVVSKEVLQHSTRTLLNLRVSGISIETFTSFIQRTNERIVLSSFDSIDFIVGESMFTFTNPVKKHIKRLSDFVLAIFIGVVTLPLLLFVIVLVKLDGGPAFYTQMRVGYLGKEFRIVKFRTMKKDAEKNGVQWCEKNDKRVTKVGRILRDYRIDEIPQIINVIRGEMSFIGPRPERPYFVRNLLEDIPQYSIRHCMRPGLSGWAQVNYDYGSSIEDSKKKLEYDLYYVKYSSFFLDLVILVKTLKIILQRKGQ